MVEYSVATSKKHFRVKMSKPVAFVEIAKQFSKRGFRSIWVRRIKTGNIVLSKVRDINIMGDGLELQAQ